MKKDGNTYFWFSEKQKAAWERMGYGPRYFSSFSGDIHAEYTEMREGINQHTSKWDDMKLVVVTTGPVLHRSINHGSCQGPANVLGKPMARKPCKPWVQSPRQKEIARAMGMLKNLGNQQ